jgi:hypothetical protein
MIQSFIMSHHTLTIRMSLWHSIHSSGGWLSKILQLIVFTIPLKLNVTSPENIKQPRKISTLSIFCSIFLQSLFLQSRSAGLMYYCHCNMYGCKCKVNVCVQYHELWSGEDAVACLLCKLISMNYVEMLV